MSPQTEQLVSDVWRHATIFLLGVLLSSAGWLFHDGASKQDIVEAVAKHSESTNDKLAPIRDKQDAMALQLEDLKRQLHRIELAVGVDAEGGSLFVTQKPKKLR